MTGSSELGRRSYRDGYAFEDRVAELYRLLHYSVEHGRIFAGRQVDLFIRRQLGDLTVLRAIECKAGPVAVDDIDSFLNKLHLVRREYPAALGTLISGVSFTDAVTSHANAVGIQLTLFRDLASQLIDAPRYVSQLHQSIEGSDRYKTALYVDQFVSYTSDADSLAAFEMINEWLADSDWNQLTLLGDVGTGKSFFSRMVALKLANEYLEEPLDHPFPVLIDLRHAAREFSLEGLILTHLVRSGLPDTSFDAFQYLLSQGRLVLLLDGFDEMAARTTPEVTTRNFHELARCVNGRAKVLLTCRTHYFKSRSEEEQVILGGASISDVNAARELYWDLISRRGFRIAYLAPFTLRQIEEYVRRARPEDANEALARIRSTYNLMELSQRPLLLDMVVKSLDKLTANQIDAATLYGVFTDAWIHRDHWRGVLSPSSKLSFLVALARSLWEQDLPSVHNEQLLSHVAKELASAITTPRELIEIDAEVRTATFLTRNAAGEYGFAHKSYAEFFLAKHIADELLQGRAEVLDVRRLGVETVGFVADILKSRQAARLLERILTKSYRPKVSENALLCLYEMRRRSASHHADVDGPEVVPMPSGAKLGGAMLAGVNLQAASLPRADFAGAVLTDSNLKRAELTGGDFTRARANNVDLRGASAEKSSWNAADLDGANLDGANMKGSSLAHANLGSAFLGECNLDGADLTAVRVARVVFGGATGERKLLAEHPADLAESVLMERLYPLIRKLARIAATVNQLDPDELAADVVIALMSKHGVQSLLDSTGVDQSRYVQWVVTSVALRAKQRRTRQAEFFVDNLPDFQDYHLDQLELAIEAQELERLGAAMAQLAPNVRRIIHQRFFEDLTLAEIAQREQLSRSAVHYRLRSGIRRMSAILGVTSPVTADDENIETQ